MLKTTLRDLKAMVANGSAIEIKKCDQVEQHLDCLAVSTGIYGITGALLKDNEGNLYAITSRISVLFCYV